MRYYNLIKPFLFSLPPEKAHNLALFALKKGVVPKQPDTQTFGVLRSNIWNFSFKNPIGMAAGFDNNAEVIKPLLSQGFGFVETGGVTLRSQVGNPKPRMFRLKEDGAIINRKGFPNAGLESYLENLNTWVKTKRSFGYKGIVGANIGINKGTKTPVDDYLEIIKGIYGLTNYININISSPNTPGLRNLQHRKELSVLLCKVSELRQKLDKELANNEKSVPILIKIAPDLTKKQQKDIVETALEYGIDGIVISNTSINLRDELESKYAKEKGGLSGKPLFELSTKVLKNIYNMTEGKIPLIGVGGISNAKDAYQKIRAGASLLQIYTALIYQGFEVVNKINQELAKVLMADGFSNISNAVGVDAKEG